MTVSQRLRTTATGLFCAGQPIASVFAKSLADQCDRMADGESLYANWAAQLEERLARVNREPRSGLDPAADALNMGDA